MTYVLDVQGFVGPHDELIFKEVAIIALEEETPAVITFKSPEDWNLQTPKCKSINAYLKMSHHGISWRCGEVPYEDLEETLTTHLKNSSYIYVNGREKVKYLEKILPNVANVEDLGCPTLRKLSKISNICYLHNENYCKKPACAAQNVIAMKEWLIDYYNSPAFTIYKETEPLKEYFTSFNPNNGVV